MPRRFPLSLLLLALLALIAWWAWPDGTTPGHPETPDAGGTAEAPAAASRDEERGEDLSAPDLARRTAPADAETAPPVAAVPNVLVRVLEGPGGAPARGAEVLLHPVGGAAGVSEAERGAFLRAHRDEQLDRWGRVFECDDAGTVRVPIGEEQHLTVGARRGDAWGSVTVPRARLEDDAEVVIELAPALHLEVLVLDERRTPVAGIPVAYRALRRGIGHSLAEVLTGADGTAHLRHLQAEFLRNESGSDQHVVAIGLPFEPTVQASFNPRQPPTEPVVLILPATGTVEVAVFDADGAPAADGLKIALQKQMPPETRQRFSGNQGMIHHSILGLRWQSVEDGVARFDRVGLGLTLECGADFERSSVMESITAAGPARAGEVVRLTLQQSQRSPHLTGRLLRADGTPLADTQVSCATYDAASSRRVTNSSIRTDAEGTFRVPYDRTAREARVGALAFTSHAADGTTGLVVVALPDSPPAADSDLGTIRFGEPIFLTARVVAPDGSACAAAYGSIEFVGDRVTAVARAMEAVQWRADAEGAILLTGAQPPGRFRLQAWSADNREWECPPVEFEAGATGVELRFTSVTAVRGRLLADPEVVIDNLRVQLDHPNPSGQQSYTYVSPSGKGEFQLKPRGSGSATLSVVTAAGEVVLQRDGLLLNPGALLDLGDLDLRGQLITTQLSLTGANGESIPQASYWIPARMALGGAFDQERARFPCAFTTAPGASLLFSAPGHGLTRVLLRGGTQSATLEPALAVRFSYSGLPSDRTWRLRLEAAPGEGQPQPRFQEPAALSEAAGSVLVMLPAAGRWKVDLELQVIADWNGRPTEFWERVRDAWGPDPWVIEAQAGGPTREFALTPDPAAVLAAIERNP